MIIAIVFVIIAIIEIFTEENFAENNINIVFILIISTIINILNLLIQQSFAKVILLNNVIIH